MITNRRAERKGKQEGGSPKAPFVVTDHRKMMLIKAGSLSEEAVEAKVIVRHDKWAGTQWIEQEWKILVISRPKK